MVKITYGNKETISLSLKIDTVFKPLVYEILEVIEFSLTIRLNIMKKEKFVK